MSENPFLIDLPESKENDAIGYDVYVDSLTTAINSDAKLIGLISNYGSGKSTVVKMLKDNNKEKDIKFVSINLWKINEENSRQKTQQPDNTIDIHKFLLRKLIQSMTNKEHENYYKRKIDNNYSIFSVVMKNKKSINMLYLLLAVFFFNIIMKLDIVGFSVPRICNFILDFTVAIGVVKILSEGEIYLAFNRDKTNRKINESETVECFNEIISEINKDEKPNCIVLCLEDLDRYNDHHFVIKVLEQIYKFYIENNSYDNVKFLLSLKSPYMLVKDSTNINSENFNDEEKKIVYSYKELYEKIFDLIIYLQTVSFQNYNTLLLELLKSKRKELEKIGLKLPDNEEEISIWSYLYKGDNVTIRDVKHRYNFFFILYYNLYKHKVLCDEPQKFDINIETCLFISYLEDEFSTEFYKLINDPIKFEKIVSNYLFNKKYDYDSLNEDFDKEIKTAFERNIIRADYSMYFYKYPNKKEIKNIYDSTIQEAIFKDSITNISDFKLYCESASLDEIKRDLKQKVLINGIPNIMFENEIIFNEGYNLFPDMTKDYLKENYLFSGDGGLKNVIKMLKKINSLGEVGKKLKEQYIIDLNNDLYENFNDEQIIENRNSIFEEIPMNEDYLYFFNENMPFVTLNEIQNVENAELSLAMINENKINDSIESIIDYIVENNIINFEKLNMFLNRIKCIEVNILKTIFYKFDYKEYSKYDKYKLFDEFYKKLELNNFSEMKTFVSAMNELPLKYEKMIIKTIVSTTGDEKKDLEGKYIGIIKECNNISSATKKYLLQCNTYYAFNPIIEEQLYNKELFIQYVYSLSNRTKRIKYEDEKFNILKDYYESYFLNSNNLNNQYVIDKKILSYLKNKISYSKLNIVKINLLAKDTQKTSDVNALLYKQYVVGENYENEVDSYFSTVSNFDDDEENEIIDNLILIIKNDNLKLSKKSYNHIKYIISKKNVYKWGKVKSRCK